MLDVAEAEPRTDGGWTKVGSKTESGSKTRKDMASITVGPSGIKRSINMLAMNNDVAALSNAMNKIDWKKGSDNEHGYVCDSQREGKQRLRWDIEHID